MHFFDAEAEGKLPFERNMSVCVLTFQKSTTLIEGRIQCNHLYGVTIEPIDETTLYKLLKKIWS